MTDEDPAFDPQDYRERIIAAVQKELDRHAASVLGETERLRDEARAERLRAQETTDRKLDALTTLVEQLTERLEQTDEHTGNRIDELTTSVKAEVERTVKERVALTDTLIAESEARSARRLEQMVADLDDTVEAVAQPMVEQLRDQQSAISRRVDQLAIDLRSFDEQAARMVRFVNEIGDTVDAKGEALVARIEEETTRRITGLDQRVEDAMALSLRQHVETTQRVKERTDRMEERMAERAYAFEEKLQAEAGQRIAEIDAHLGRVSAGLDDTVEVINERLTAIEEKVAGFEQRLAEVREEFQNLDSEALDGLKEQVQSAVGEATLVRIDMDRLQARLSEQVDSLTVQVTELQSEVADATMDVNTAVQLERLEELERAVLELDPAKFVLKEGAEFPMHSSMSRTAATAPPASPGDAPGTSPTTTDVYDTRAMISDSSGASEPAVAPSEPSSSDSSSDTSPSDTSPSDATPDASSGSASPEVAAVAPSDAGTDQAPGSSAPDPTDELPLRGIDLTDFETRPDAGRAGARPGSRPSGPTAPVPESVFENPPPPPDEDDPMARLLAGMIEERATNTTGRPGPRIRLDDLTGPGGPGDDAGERSGDRFGDPAGDTSGDHTDGNQDRSATDQHDDPDTGPSWPGMS